MDEPAKRRRTRSRPKQREPALIGRGLTRSFGGGSAAALDDVDIEIGKGEVVAVRGASGSGKSTLLLCLGAVDRPTRGSVMFEGRDLASLSDRERSEVRRRSFGFVFQFGRLVPELTVEENVMLPLLLNGVRPATARPRAAAALERLGVAPLANRTLGEVSGGEGQRVAVARALVTGPAVVFADEPTGALDSRNGEIVLDLLLGCAREAAATVVLVTHDEHVARHADRQIHLRDGRVVTRGQA